MLLAWFPRQTLDNNAEASHVSNIDRCSVALASSWWDPNLKQLETRLGVTRPTRGNVGYVLANTLISPGNISPRTRIFPLDSKHIPDMSSRFTRKSLYMTNVSSTVHLMLRGVVTHCASGHGGLDLITRFLLRGNDVKLPRLDSNQDNICLALIQVTSDRHHPTDYTHRADPLHSMHPEPHGIIARADSEDTVSLCNLSPFLYSLTGCTTFG